MLNEYFILAEGVPEVVLGYGRETTEASSNVLVIAFQQMVEYNQLFFEAQLDYQLNLQVEFVFPIDMAISIKKDAAKDGPVNTVPKPSEISPPSQS
jgi:hypothetical protein